VRRAAPLVLAAALCGAACVTPGAHAPAAPAGAGPGERWLDVDGAWLRVRDEGSGPPVVLVHGFGLSLASFSALARELACCHRVISYDQRGFGRSERPASGYGTARHARDLITLVRRLGLQRPVLVGHSYGASVALAVARELGEGARLVLVDGLVVESQRTATMRWAQLPVVGEIIFGALWAGRPDEDVLVAFDRPARDVTLTTLADYRANLAPAGSRFAALHTMRGLELRHSDAPLVPESVPLTVAWCAGDRVTTFDAARIVVAATPHARLARLDGCGHMPAHEQPRALADVIARAARGEDLPSP
jgi:pimeloyl-ACP methyl ester carboxylesterase